MAMQLKADNSLPRNGVIAFYSALTVVVLFTLKFVFDSYFHMMIDEVHRERAAMAALPSCAANAPAAEVGVSCRRGTSSMDELQSMRARETEMLGGGHGAMPVDNAMRSLASSRSNPMVAPEASTEMAPIKGWTHIPHFVTTARPNMDTTAAPAPAPAAPATNDMLTPEGQAAAAGPAAEPAAAPTAAAPAAAPAAHAEGHATP